MNTIKKQLLTSFHLPTFIHSIVMINSLRLYDLWRLIYEQPETIDFQRVHKAKGLAFSS